jgi:hypothetical protein
MPSAGEQSENQLRLGPRRRSLAWRYRFFKGHIMKFPRRQFFALAACRLFGAFSYRKGTNLPIEDPALDRRPWVEAQR